MTSQIFFDDALADKVFQSEPYMLRDDRQAPNRNDMVYKERQVDGSVAGDHRMLDLRPAKRGFTGTFAIALTDGNLRPPRGRGFGGPPPGGPPPFDDDWCY